MYFLWNSFSIWHPKHWNSDRHPWGTLALNTINDVTTSKFINHSNARTWKRVTNAKQTSIPLHNLWHTSLCCCPPFFSLNIGGNYLFSLFLSHIHPWHLLCSLLLPCLHPPPPWELFTCKARGRSVKVCRKLEALLLPEPRLWKLNGSSVFGVHDTTVGTLISAGKGHHDPWGCMLERRQQSATDTKVNGNSNHEIFFPERRRLNLIPWEMDLPCIRKQSVRQSRCFKLLAGRPLGPTQFFFKHPQKKPVWHCWNKKKCGSTP